MHLSGGHQEELIMLNGLHEAVVRLQVKVLLTSNTRLALNHDCHVLSLEGSVYIANLNRAVMLRMEGPCCDRSLYAHYRSL